MAEQAKSKWNSFKLEIITPERIVVDEEVEGVILPSTDGLLVFYATTHPLSAHWILV